MKNSEEQAGLGPLKAIGKLFETIQGWCTLIPGIVMAIDWLADFLPISSALKPLTYLLTLVLIVYSVFSESYRYANLNLDSASVRRITIRARWAIVSAIIIGGIYWIAIQSSDSWMPQTPVLRSAVLFGLALLIAFFFQRITVALLVLAWRKNLTPPRERIVKPRKVGK